MAKLTKMVPNAKGILIGDGPERTRLKALVRKFNLQKKVTVMLPIKSTKRLYSFINSSAATLNMSEREGLSMIALESLALNTPVVLPSYSPIPKEVKDMCIVAKEQNIPKILADIIKSKTAKPKNTDGLSFFETSGIKKFYASLFKKLIANR